MTAWRVGYAQSGSERIYWECSGDGIPIVICHGAGSGHLSFYQQVAGLASDAIRIVTWDQRGYCNSTLNSGQAGIGISVDDMTSVIRAAGLESTPIHLVGQAMGAFVAAHWAITHPGFVATLALWGGPFEVSADRQSLLWGLAPDDKGVQSTQINRQIGQSRSFAAEFLARDRAGAFLYQSLQELGQVRPSYAAAFAAAKAAPVPLRSLAALDVPILIGRGEFDHTADPAAYEALAALLPTARTVILPGCAHASYFEAPKLWNEATLHHVYAALASLETWERSERKV
jgi:3-oxoadipate enol-lactonase